MLLYNSCWESIAEISRNLRNLVNRTTFSFLKENFITVITVLAQGSYLDQCSMVLPGPRHSHLLLYWRRGKKQEFRELPPGKKFFLFYLLDQVESSQALSVQRSSCLIHRRMLWNVLGTCNKFWVNNQYTHSFDVFMISFMAVARWVEMQSVMELIE